MHPLLSSYLQQTRKRIAASTLERWESHFGSLPSTHTFQGGDTALETFVSSCNEETPTVTFVPMSGENEILEDGDTTSDATMDLDDDDASTVAFASATDEGSDYSLGSGTVRVIHNLTTPNSFLHREMTQLLWTSTAGRRSPRVQRPPRTRRPLRV